MMKRTTLVTSRLAAAGLIAGIALAGCGSNTEDLHPGQAIARTNGCAACHGTSGQGGVGPSFVGLYGNEVELNDGTTVTADETYLRRSIVDPGADVREGYGLSMPSNNLSDADIDQIIAYIESLADETP